jgi:hypothetical protein
MGYRIRQIEVGTKFNALMGIETLTRVIAMELIQATVRECGVEGQRAGRLPGWLTVLFCIGMNRLSGLSMTSVMEPLMRGIRLIHASDEEEAPSSGTDRQARSRSGTKVMERLFKRVCRPLARADTAGAFADGLRLVALDGSVDDVPDSAANSAYLTSQRAAWGERFSPSAVRVPVRMWDPGPVRCRLWAVAVSERRGGKRRLAFGASG